MHRVPSFLIPPSNFQPSVESCMYPIGVLKCMQNGRVQKALLGMCSLPPHLERWVGNKKGRSSSCSSLLAVQCSGKVGGSTSSCLHHHCLFTRPTTLSPSAVFSLQITLPSGFLYPPHPYTPHILAS